MPIVVLLLLLSLASGTLASTLPSCERNGTLVYSRDCLDNEPAPAAPGADHAPHASASALKPDDCSPAELARSAFKGTPRLRRCALTAAKSGQATEDGRTLLHWAVTGGQVKTAQWLIDIGAPLSAGSRRDLGGQPLHLAAEAGDRAMTRLLLKAGAPVDGRDLFGYTPLHRAAAAGQVAVVEALLASGADIEARDRTGKTPLLLAVSHQRPEILDRLLQAGADPGVSTHKGRNALHYAEGDAELMVKVLAAGADEPPAQAGNSPLRKLIKSGAAANWESIRQLLLLRPDMARRDSYALLVLSLEQNHLPLFRLLLQQGANAGELRLARFQERPEFLRALLKHGIMAPARGDDKIADSALPRGENKG
ncbi:ankyrin repeat domain-containing protein [Motiliproteus sp. SC1-56]|uniref:ankyrin repeat domain-containing protein n=1 Tax=Motiliproteus sp. SC1-56 TaxID=2799565 RepID=UPI001A8D4B11|nr:ankyrin repeat domain-containing protein [Motiliproteus sp. SC1-56]